MLSFSAFPDCTICFSLGNVKFAFAISAAPIYERPPNDVVIWTGRQGAWPGPELANQAVARYEQQ